MQLAAVGVEALQAPRQARGKVTEGATTEFSGYAYNGAGRPVHRVEVHAWEATFSQRVEGYQNVTTQARYIVEVHVRSHLEQCK